MYCVKCGVELEDGIEACPLCGTTVHYPEDTEHNLSSEYPLIKINLHEIKMTKMKKTVFITLLLISLLVILELGIQNILVYHKITWSYYAIASILFFDLFLFTVLSNHKIFVKWTIFCFGLSIFLLVLDVRNLSFSWSLRYGLPIVAIIYVLSLFFLYIVRKRNNKFVMINYFISLIGLFLLMLEFLIRQKFTWSIFSSIPLFILALVLKYIYRNYREEITKRLHL